MKTTFQNKKIYSLALIAIALLSVATLNAQDTLKKENDAPEKKKTVTRIIIYKDEDGKTVKEDTTIYSDSFNWNDSKKDLDFDFDITLPDLPDLAALSELPEPPVNNRLHYIYSFNNDQKLSAHEKEKLIEEMATAQKEVEKACIEINSINKNDLKKQVDDLKKEMEALKKEIKKMKK